MKNEVRPALIEPDIATYEKSELTIRTEFAITGRSVFDSSRRIKINFAGVSPDQVLRRLLAV